MLKRALAGFLWFMAVAYAWNMLALAAGMSEWPGLVLGVLAAGLVAGDPFQRFWSRRDRQASPSAISPVSPTAAPGRS